jgi:hypothetical protein
VLIVRKVLTHEQCVGKLQFFECYNMWYMYLLTKDVEGVKGKIIYGQVKITLIKARTEQ